MTDTGDEMGLTDFSVRNVTDIPGASVRPCRT